MPCRSVHGRERGPLSIKRGTRSRHIGGGANGGKEVTFICLASLERKMCQREVEEVQNRMVAGRDRIEPVL